MLVFFMNFLKIFIGVLIALSASRFIPHPPNFTSLIALIFIFLLFWKRYIPIVLAVLALTDLIIGLHSTILFTWGSVILIGLISKFFNLSVMYRISGALVELVIFCNNKFWCVAKWGYGYELLAISCYILALPFSDIHFYQL